MPHCADGKIALAYELPVALYSPKGHTTDCDRYHSDESFEEGPVLERRISNLTPTANFLRTGIKHDRRSEGKGQKDYAWAVLIRTPLGLREKRIILSARSSSIVSIAEIYNSLALKILGEVSRNLFRAYHECDD